MTPGRMIALVLSWAPFGFLLSAGQQGLSNRKTETTLPFAGASLLLKGSHFAKCVVLFGPVHLALGLGSFGVGFSAPGWLAFIPGDWTNIPIQ